MVDITIFVTQHHLVLEGNTPAGKAWVDQQPWRERAPELLNATMEEIAAAGLTCDVEMHR
jgi:hypothetical protein